LNSLTQLESDVVKQVSSSKTFCVYALHAVLC